jgi:polyisoprenoid-binding protein YceI/sugar lactone lactonase YvrE
MMKNKLLFTLLFMSVLYCSCKQNTASITPELIEPSTNNIVSTYGPTRMVRSVKQAKNGDILIASYTGVWRYDGKLFTNITGAIKSPSFWDVLEDQKGNLWFGTKDSGIYCYNGKSFLHYTIRQGLPSNMALHLFEDKAGNIWIGAGGGATRFNGKSFRNFTPKDGLPNGGVNTFMEDTKGNIWMGTRGDACYYDGKKFTIFKNKEGKPFYNVWGIIEDRKGNIWFGGSIIKKIKGSTLYLDGGLWRYDGSTYTKVSSRGASSIIEDKNGNIWTTGEVKPNKPNIGNDWVLARYDQQSLYNKEPVVTEIKSKYEGGRGMLGRILEARDGSIWLGSLTGVYRLEGTSLNNFQRNEDQIYTIDNKQSLITWKGSMKLSPEEKHVGYISVSKSELWMENNQLVGGNVQIDMNSMEYADKKDKNTPIHHLKSEDYFDVKRFPFASIEIAKVDSVNANTINITGYLTIKSSTREVKFPATVSFKNGVFTADAKLTINRTLWGIDYRSARFYEKIADYTVSNEIEFVIKVVAKK